MLKRFGIVPLILTMAATLLVVDIAPAPAQTCDSVCNQIRRACRRISRTTKKVTQAGCDDTRDGCRTDCDTNAATCPDDCYALYVEPELTQCLEACAQCKSTCNANRAACRAAAKTDQGSDNLRCDDLRTSCGQECTPPDATCVRASHVTRRGCDADAKKTAITCKRGCTKGPGRRACVRGCRAQLNVDLGVCSDTEVSDLAKCAGIIL